MKWHVLDVFVGHQQHARLAFASSNWSTVALCDLIALVYRIERIISKQEGRLLAEVESGRPFRGMFGEASADQRGGVGGHGGLAGFGGGNYGGLQLALLSGHFAAGGDGRAHGKESIFGSFLSSLGLADLLNGHDWCEAVELLVSCPHTVTRGGRINRKPSSQFTNRNLWRTA
jgi:hypothetical protein